MEHARHGDRHVIRFEPDEVFPERFITFLKARSIRGGVFTGIGAVKRAT
nr:DUF296 domain-containing protein [Gemmatimonadota bacterium]NIS01069.1 DUF296 domain-containing protein [Gemmatimonadota bacterium]NIT69082.1 DUF296 domain-containing protein [Gemmatimonadota bacterium]NIU54095.1 DUF296 domain-containing protein [Gemmatimonadota bacterium]NIV23337.1 DUF296 domain-containing protein [Gemmatimonadota bacterium]